MDSLIGKQIDQYFIQRLIARGGMAEVYLATDVTLQRQVALKVMLPDLARDRTATARFQREAESVARLSHPNIIQIYTTGLTPGSRPYLAMQFVEGGTLQQHLAEQARQGRQMSVADSLYLTRQVAAALQVAHRNQIVHRDLKPSNILLRPDGEPVLTDLGIAAVDTGDARLTQTGHIMGTPYYMSPEQALGRQIDGRTDIYSLGIILYELLTGNVPFAADSPIAILHQQVHEPPRPLAQMRPELSDMTYRTVARCLEKDPERRFQTAGELVIALDHSLVSEGLATPKSMPTYPNLPAQKKRRLWPYVAVAGLAVLLAAALFWAILPPPPATPAPDLPTEIPAAATIVEAPTDTVTIVKTQTIAPLTTSTVESECAQSGETAEPVIGKEGNLCFAGEVILNIAEEAAGCLEIGQLEQSPTAEYFSVLLSCYEGDNQAYIYRADGSDKHRITGEWDYINFGAAVWTDDGRFFVYERINSCCLEAPPEAPEEGVVWYEVQTGQKQMHGMPSPLESYEVVGVASDDVLNVRDSAGVSNSQIGAIPHDGSEVAVIGLGRVIDSSIWAPIRYGDLKGWVNSEFLWASGADGRPPPPETPLTTADVSAKFATSPPNIDGDISDWPGAPSYQSAHIVYTNDAWDGSTDIDAVWQLSWDIDYLYLAAAVSDNIHVQGRNDDQIWKGDSVEIQFDTDFEGDRGTVRNTDDFQLNVSPGDFQAVPEAAFLWRSNAASRYEWVSTASIRVAARSDGDAGYTVEIAIPWRDLVTSPAPGIKLGIALNVSDNDGPGTEIQEIMKSHVSTRNYNNPDSWGTVVLEE